MNYDYPRRKIIAISKEYPFEESRSLQSFIEADNFIDPNLFDVVFLHDGKAMVTRYRGTWGYFPKGMVRKSDPLYKRLQKIL